MKPRSSRTRRARRQPAAFGRLCVETRQRVQFRADGQPAAFGRLCVETAGHGRRGHGRGCPAAFGRLCVETSHRRGAGGLPVQPPSGGCVLKLAGLPCYAVPLVQPPSGGCVLKQVAFAAVSGFFSQPPSGGCVLKPKPPMARIGPQRPAAFGRLCVETCKFAIYAVPLVQPPSGGCVLKQRLKAAAHQVQPSRLRAAVC